MATRLPFEYATGCTGPAVDTDIIPPGLPVCTGPTFEVPDVYVAPITSPDVQPPPCVTPGSDTGGYSGMWKVEAADNSHVDIYDSADEDSAGEVVGKQICTGSVLVGGQDDRRDVPIPATFRAGTGELGYIVLKYKYVPGPPEELQPDPDADNNISTLTAAEYLDALDDLEDDEQLVVLARVWTNTPGGELQLQQEQYGPVETEFGGNCDADYIGKVKSRSGEQTYVVDVYTGWFYSATGPTGAKYTLPDDKKVVTDGTMKTPTLDDT